MMMMMMNTNNTRQRNYSPEAFQQQQGGSGPKKGFPLAMNPFQTAPFTYPIESISSLRATSDNQQTLLDSGRDTFSYGLNSYPSQQQFYHQTTANFDNNQQFGQGQHHHDNQIEGSTNQDLIEPHLRKRIYEENPIDEAEYGEESHHNQKNEDETIDLGNDSKLSGRSVSDGSSKSLTNLTSAEKLKKKGKQIINKEDASNADQTAGVENSILMSEKGATSSAAKKKTTKDKSAEKKPLGGDASEGTVKKSSTKTTLTKSPTADDNEDVVSQASTATKKKKAISKSPSTQ